MSHEETNPICDDLEALRECTEHGLPRRAQTARTVRARLARSYPEGPLMKFTRSVGSRPVVATAIGIALAAIAMVAIPISYVRTVGYQATLSLPSTDFAQSGAIAAEFAKVMNTKEYNFNQDGAQGTTITARVPVRSRRVVEGLAQAFAQTLAMRGIGASSQVAPVTRQISGNVYAAMANRIYEFHVSRDGKTNEEIAAELRQQFEAAGLPGAEVQVTGDGNETRMEMRYEAPPGSPSGEEKQFNITIGGNGGQAGAKASESRPVPAGSGMQRQVVAQPPARAGGAARK